MKTALDYVNSRFSTRETRANNPRDWNAPSHNPKDISRDSRIEANNPRGNRLSLNSRGFVGMVCRLNNPFTAF